jgi:hypothetical protein
MVDSSNLYTSIDADDFYATHECEILNATFSHSCNVVQDATMGDCLLELVKIADPIEFQSVASLIPTSCSLANA